MALGTRSLVGGVVVLAALVVVSRGGSGRGGPGGAKSGALDPADSPTRNAVYAATVPVIKGARFRETTGGNYYDDIGGPVTFTSTSWFFDLEDPVATVAAFYQQHLPAGWKPTEAEEGEAAFEWLPPGASEGEEVTVTVRAGELQISETVKAKGG